MQQQNIPDEKKTIINTTLQNVKNKIKRQNSQLIQLTVYNVKQIVKIIKDKAKKNLNETVLTHRMT